MVTAYEKSKRVDDWVAATELIIKLKPKVVETLQVLPLEVQKADCKRNSVALAFFI